MSATHPRPQAETGHTPTPYKVVPPGHGHATDCLCMQIGEDELYTTLELRAADARFIVRACNSHDALVKAAAQAVHWFDTLTEGEEEPSYEHDQMVAEQLRAALALARGEGDGDA